MHKLLNPFLLVFSVIPSILFAQESNFNTKVIKDKRLSLGIHFSPDFCNGRLKGFDDREITSFFLNDINKYKKLKFGFRVGISTCYRFSKSFSIETGLQYSNEGFRSTGSDLVYGDMIDPRYGFIYTSQPVNLSTPTPDYHYLNIPLQANYYFGKNKTLLVGFGVTTGFLLKTSIQSDNFNPISLSPTLSFGIEPQINDKMYLRFEPQFRYALTSVMDEALITAYLWSIGVKISYYYKLK